MMSAFRHRVPTVRISRKTRLRTDKARSVTAGEAVTACGGVRLVALLRADLRAVALIGAEEGLTLGIRRTGVALSLLGRLRGGITLGCGLLRLRRNVRRPRGLGVELPIVRCSLHRVDHELPVTVEAAVDRSFTL